MKIDKDLVVTSIVFQPEVVQIAFFERGDQAENGGLEQILTVATEEYDSLLDEIQQVVSEDIIEDFKTKMRNPPETLPASGSRISRGANKNEPTEDV